MLMGGFIGGFFAYASENDLTQKHPVTANKKKQFYGKILQYSSFAAGIYFIVYSEIESSAILAGLIYLYADYGFPKVMRLKYEKIFAGSPSEAKNQETE